MAPGKKKSVNDDAPNYVIGQLNQESQKLHTQV